MLPLSKEKRLHLVETFDLRSFVAISNLSAFLRFFCQICSPKIYEFTQKKKNPSLGFQWMGMHWKSFKLIEMAGNCLGCIEVAGNGRKCLNMAVD